MAVIYSYNKKDLPALDDLLLISDASARNKTKQITIEGVRDAIDVVDTITATLPLAVSNATGDVNISIESVIPIILGGTGLDQVGTTGQFLAVNSDGTGLEYVSVQPGGGSVGIKQDGVEIIPQASILNFTSGILATANGTEADLKAVYNTNLSNDTEMAATIGGFEDGTKVSDIKDMDLVQMWDTLLFPTVLPTYKPALLSLSSNITGTKEVGSVISPTLSILGTKRDAGDYIRLQILRGSTSLTTLQNPPSTVIGDLPQQFGFENENNPNKTYTTSVQDELYEIPAPTGNNTSTQTTYSGSGDYVAGLALKDNKGDFDTRQPAIGTTAAPQAAQNNKGSNNIVITGYYPYYYGEAASMPTANDIRNLILQDDPTVNKVLQNSAGDLTMSFDTDGGFCWFIIFKNFANKTAWVDTSNPLNNGNIGLDPTDLFAAPIQFTIKSYDNYWEVDYNVYIATKPTTAQNLKIS